MTSNSIAQPFNPYTQTLIILDAEGNPNNVSISDIDAYVNYGVRICINYASQIGASVVLLVVLLLLTKKEKRTSAIFALNGTALFFNAIRNLFQSLYFTGQFYEFYTYFSEDYSMVPASQYRISVASLVLGTIVVICIQASLILQVRAVCITMRETYRLIALLFCVAIALAVVSVRFALMVQDARATLASQTFSSGYSLAASSNYVLTASICFFSFIFAMKLGIAIRERRRLGLRQFGPMQVIFIMGCQTLVIPAIFAILENFTTVPELGSQVLTVTSIFLPLSSMWASASLDANKPANAPSSNGSKTGWRRLLGSYFSGNSNALSGDRKGSAGFLRRDGISSAKISTSPVSPSFARHKAQLSGDSSELIHVGHSVSVLEEKV